MRSRSRWKSLRVGAGETAKRRPRERSENVTAAAKILKVFSTQKGITVLGGRVESGELLSQAPVRIMRDSLEIGTGEIETLQSGKAPVKKVEKGLKYLRDLKYWSA